MMDDNFKDEANNEVDSKESLKIDSVFGFTDIYQLAKWINPANFYKKSYLSLDSRYATEINTERTKFTWAIVNNINTQEGSANVMGNLRNVVSIKCLASRFSILAFKGQIFTAKRLIKILIHELSSQSFYSSDGNYHFVGQNITKPLTTNVAQYSVSTSFDTEYNKGIFNFTQPITNLDRMTLSVSALDSTPAVLLPDTYINCSINLGAYPTSFIITTGSHQLLFGSPLYVGKVYISNFTTSTPSNDTLAISFINEPSGYPMTVINSTQIQVFPTFTKYPAASLPAIVGVPSNVTVYLGIRRLLFNFEIIHF